MDLIVAAFSQTPHRKLIVIGDGPEMGKIRKLAGPNITLLGYQEDEVLKTHLETAKAFVFAAEEDFGILPVEAQAAGAPVIASEKGVRSKRSFPSKTPRIGHPRGFSSRSRRLNLSLRLWINLKRQNQRSIHRRFGFMPKNSARNDSLRPIQIS